MPAPRRRLAASAAALSASALFPAALWPQAAAADVLAPDSPASGSASATRVIYLIMAVLALLLVLAVLAAILRAVRGSRGRDAEPDRRTRAAASAQRRVGLGLGAAVLVLFVVGVIFTERARKVEASESGAEPITIDAYGQQWLWRYEYPEAKASADGYSGETPYSFYELVVPVDTPIELNVGSTDVMHRWWVPALGRSADAVPGVENTISFTADEVGTYPGRSTEYSGPGFSTMRTVVEVVEPEDYQAFLEERTQAIVEARQDVQDRVEAGTAPGVELEQ